MIIQLVLIVIMKRRKKRKITVDAEGNIRKHLQARVNVNLRDDKFFEQLMIIEYFAKF